MALIDTYPTAKTVETASHVTVCKWYRFLRSPATNAEREILDMIMAKFKRGGGFTPEISKQIGWGEY